ncbi:MAG: HAD family hydrolase [Planctomycetes bacterium]|nr:HAD family hydrolase [Planctomycetota bacterium]
MGDRRGEIRAVVFDFGDTLVSFGKVKASKLFRASSRLSYEFLKSCGQPVGNFGYYCLRNLLAIRTRCLLSAITGSDFDSLLLLKKINGKTGVKLSEEQWEHLAWLWYEPLCKLGKAEPELKDSVAGLKKLGLKLGILSNTFVTSSSLDRHLEQLGISEFFGVRLYSYQFNFRKPNPLIFEVAAERVGEKPGNILFVGDRINKDVAPALKAGMHAALISAYTNEGKAVPAAAWKIDTIRELPDLVENFNSNYVNTD